MTTKTLLAIETSCDETSVAVLRINKEPLESVIQGDAGVTSFETLSHITLSQADMHAQYGGVFPTMARRDHQNNIVSVIAEALDKAELLKPSVDQSSDEVFLNYLDREEPVRQSLTDFVTRHPAPDIDAIAVTTGPGLEPALWVGVSTAKALADYWNVPLVPVNHMEGHILSVIAQGNNFSVPEISFPALALLISGGHTELVSITSLGNYTKIGQTRDDAVGEAFDKVARLLGLPYPGGPQISRLAAEYEKHVIQSGAKQSEGSRSNKQTPLSMQRDPSIPRDDAVVLPRPMMHSGDYDFSFSGIKTAVRYLIESLPKPLDEHTQQHIAHEFETAVTEVLVHKTRKAIAEYGFQSLIVAGGVAANNRIRSELQKLCDESGITLYLPSGVLTMDNALMIGIAGAIKYLSPDFQTPDLSTITANGNWSL